jgi:hypothetical protein
LTTRDVGVVPPTLPTPRKIKVKYAMLATLRAAVMLGAVLKDKKKTVKPERTVGCALAVWPLSKGGAPSSGLQCRPYQRNALTLDLL